MPWPNTLALLVIGLAAGCAPLLPLRVIAARYVDQARDWWLVGLAWVCAIVLLAREPALGLIAIAALVQWRTHAQLPSVLTWAGIIAVWFLVGALPVSAHGPVSWLWRAIAVGQVVMAMAQRLHGLETKGTMGSRIILAPFLALMLPFAAPWEWPIYAVGLWLTCSWLAILAAGVGIAIRYPVSAPWVAAELLLLAALFVAPWTRRQLIDRTPRGSSLDGLRTRWATWTALCRLWWRWPIWAIGSGPGGSGIRTSTEADLERESVRRHSVLLTSPCHCEPLELAYTYGLLGIAAMGAMLWRLAPHLALGDPWTASVVTGLVLMLASSPCRAAPIGLTWWVAVCMLVQR